MNEQDRRRDAVLETIAETVTETKKQLGEMNGLVNRLILRVTGTDTKGPEIGESHSLMEDAKICRDIAKQIDLKLRAFMAVVGV